jgi:valyl-tRNA synthetase
MMAKLTAATAEVTQAIEDYRFSEAGQIVYSLLWDDFADWYVEASKVSPNHDLLIHALRTILTLVHPIAPFVSEAIWSHLPGHEGQLITTTWPVADITRTPSDKALAERFSTLQAVVQAARTVMAEEQLTKPTLLTTSPELAEDAALIKRLARAGAVEQVKQGSGLYLGTTVPAWIQATTQQVEARRHRLEAQLQEKQTYLHGLTAKLANRGYTDHAPAAVVQDTRDRQAETQALIDRLGEQLTALGHV